jgi:hypothetical protein
MNRLLFVLVALVACSKKETSAPATGSGSAGSGSAAVATAPPTTTTPPPPPPPPPPAGPRGRAAKDNRAALVPLATANESCKLDPAYPKNSCTDQVKAFEAALDPASDLPTLINFLDDPSPQVRFLAVRALDDKMLLQTKPARALASRITAAATAETDVTTAKLFGEVLLEGDFTDKSYADAIGVLLEKHALPAMRAAIASNLAVQDEARWIPVLIARYAAEHDNEVKVAILGAMYTARDAAKICPFLLDAMKDPDNELAGIAGYGLVWSDGKCKDSYDSFIAAYTAHIATTKPDYLFMLKTAYMAQAKGATDEQKAKFKEATKAVAADPKVSGMARANALETIGDKAYAKGFVADPDSSVASAAKKLAK